MEMGERLVPGLLDAMRHGCHLAGWLLTAHVRARALELIRDVSPEISVTEGVAEDLWGACWCRLACWPGRGGDVLGRVALAVVHDLTGEWGPEAAGLESVGEPLVAPTVRDPVVLLERAVRRGILASDQCRLLVQVELVGLTCSEIARRDGVDERRVRRRRREALAALARNPRVFVEAPAPALAAS